MSTQSERTCCGATHKHPPHDECVGIPLPPIEQVRPDTVEALNADARRQLAWTEQP